MQMTPDIDKQELSAAVLSPPGYTVELSASIGGAPVSTVEGNTQTGLPLPIKSSHLWSPADPCLYDLTIRLKKGGKIIDEVKSYFECAKSASARMRRVLIVYFSRWRSSRNPQPIRVSG
jgi:hypothetical protein